MLSSQIMNIHQRIIPIGLAELGDLLETLASPDDRIWTTRIIAPMQLDQGLAVGSNGGHGPTRYKVIEHEPGCRIRFQFAPGSPLLGWHQFDVAEVSQAEPPLAAPDLYADRERSLIRHTIEARLDARGRFLWPLFIRWFHDAALEDMFTHLEVAFGGRPHPQQPIPKWVRWLGALLMRLTRHTEWR
jgi:hypothetical protein